MAWLHSKRSSPATSCMVLAALFCTLLWLLDESDTDISIRTWLATRDHFTSAALAEGAGFSSHRTFRDPPGLHARTMPWATRKLRAALPPKERRAHVLTAAALRDTSAKKSENVLLFGTPFCGPCKLMQRRLDQLELQAGTSWRYVDLESTDEGDGFDVFAQVMGGPPAFMPDVPVLVVLSSSGEAVVAEAGKQLLAMSDADLLTLLAKAERGN